MLLMMALYFAVLLLPELFFPSAAVWVQMLAMAGFLRLLTLKRPVWLGLTRRMTARGIVLTVLTALAVFFVSTFFVAPIWSFVFVRSAEAYAGTVNAMMRSPLPGFVQVCVIAPIAEEVFFRGYVLPNVRVRHGKAAALVVTTALFSMLHFNLYQMASVALVGVALGALYLRTGTVWYPILFHFLYNLISFLLLLMMN